jgi:hypothetical protein
MAGYIYRLTQSLDFGHVNVDAYTLKISNMCVTKDVRLSRISPHLSINGFYIFR